MKRLNPTYPSTISLLTLTFILLQCSFATAQLNFPVPFGPTCSEAPLFCGDFLENYLGTNEISYNDSIPNNPSSCQIENAVWLAIPVCETGMSFDISATNCNNPTGGLELFLLDSTDCENYNFIFNDCEIVANGSTSTVTFSGLDGTSIYYLLIDGIDGDICEFHISNVNGVLFETGQEPIDTTNLVSVIQLDEGQIIGPDVICPGDEVTYTFIPGTCQTIPCQYNGPDPIQGVPSDCEIPGVCDFNSTDTTVVNWGFPDSVIVINDDSMSFDITLVFDIEFLLNYYNDTIPTSGSDTIPFTLNADLETIWDQDSLYTNNIYCDCPGGSVCDYDCDKGATKTPEIHIDFFLIEYYVCELDFQTFTTPGGNTISNNESVIEIDDCSVTTYRVLTYPPDFYFFQAEICPGDCTSAPPFGNTYCAPGTYWEIDIWNCEEWLIEIIELVPTDIDLGVVELCPGQTYPSPIGPLSAGSHSWPSTDPANGCPNTTSITITEGQSAIVNLPDEFVCSGETYNSPNGPLGVGPHSWDEPDPNTGCNTTYNILILEYNITDIDLGNVEVCAGETFQSPIGPLGAGSHSWSSIDPNNGCSNTTSITLVESNVPTLSIVNTTDVSCFAANDGSAAVLATGTNPMAYTWDAGASNQTGPFASGLAAGNYSVTAEDGTGCINTISVSINEPSELIVSVVSTIPTDCIQNSGSIIIDVNGGVGNYTFNWSDGTTTSQNLTDADAGSYSVTVTDNNGCESFASGTVPSPILPTGTSSSTPVSCPTSNDGSITIDITTAGSYSYSWVGYPSLSGSFNDGLEPGIYEIIAIDNATGCEISLLETLLQPDPAFITLNEFVCQGETFNSPIGILPVGSHSGQAIDPNTGCLADYSIEVEAYEVTDVDLGLVEICPEDSYPSPIGPLSAGTHSWPSIDPANGCVNNTFIIVQNFVVSPNDYGDFTVCEGECLEFNGDLYCTPGINTFPDTSLNGCATDGQLNLIITPIEINNLGAANLCPNECYSTPDGDLCTAGTFTWNTININTGCTIENSITLTLTEAQDSFLGVFDLCEGECYPINDSLYCQPGLHNFPQADMNGCIIDVSFELNYLISDTTYLGPFYICEGECIEPLPGWIICDEGFTNIEIVGLNACPEVYVVEVIVSPIDNVSIGPVTEICNGLGQSYTISFDIDGYAPFLINGDTITDNFYTSDYIPSDSSYFYEVKTTSDCSLIAIVSGNYTCPLLEEIPNNNYYVPNVFSPNNDNVNDYFEIMGTEELEQIIELNVFDRWGQLVFSVKDYKPGDLIGQWNGNSRRGKKLNPAVFIYQAQIAFSDGTSEQIQGEVTLLR